MNNQATLGGGCFWCTEAVFRQVAGIIDVVCGYSGGEIANPSYQQVCSGSTGHAEVVQISFDSSVISYEEIIKLHLLSHDPTTLNQQGADRGTQYRSIIFTHNEDQLHIAREVIDAMKPVFDNEIVTVIEPLVAFFRAEDFHQEYYANNTDAGYCQVVISPKLQKFRSRFADKLK